MKKILIGIGAAVLAALLIACGSGQEPDGTAPKHHAPKASQTKDVQPFTKGGMKSEPHSMGFASQPASRKN